MSATVDQRVVEMRFDNKQFESNVSTTMSTLDKLKQRLNLTSAAKGLENVGAAANSVNLSGLGGAVESLQAKFSALQVMGITALANLTNSAVNAGKRIASALTIDPIKTGFAEYETQINAVQTILANTSSKGTTIKDVNAALDELNTYADKTIYNFTEMTRNIGTFTAAGVDLETSTSAIQGIANLAAVSGSNSQQASTAMYQLSQALAAGTVKLMDWNSVVNAGMGGQVFQDALKDTSRQMVKNAKALKGMTTEQKKAFQESHGYTDEQMKSLQEYSFNVDDIIKKNGSFRESLQEGWITADVLTTTLNKMTKSGVVDYVADMTGASKDSIKELQKLGDTYGYDSDKVKELANSIAKGDEALSKSVIETVKMATTAEDAATKVKTFTQLWDTLKEAAQSGWTQSWEILVGDFEEAKEMLTKVSDVVGKMIGDSAEARNKLLQGWKDAGGRDDLMEGFANAFHGIMNIVKPITEAFRDIFPPLTVKNLLGFTEGFKALTAQFKGFGTKYADQIKRTFTGLFSILDIGKKIISSFAKSIMKLTGSSGIANLGDLIMNSVASIGDFFTSLNKGFDTNGLSDIFSKMASGISSALDISVNALKNFGSVLPTIGDFIVDVATKIWTGVKTVFGWISENFSAGDIFAGLAGGGVFLAAKKIIGFVNSIKEAFDGLFGKDTGDGAGSIKEKFSELLDGVGETLQSFSSSVKSVSFVAVAASIAILASAFEKISKLDAVGISKSLITMGVALGIMMKALNTMPTSTKSKMGFKKLFGSGFSEFSETTNLIKGGIALMFMAKAIDILSEAMLKLSDLSWEEIGKGLAGVGGGIAGLCGGLKLLNGTKVSIGTSIAMLALAEACKILGDAMQKFVGFSWDEIARGLVGMGGAIGEMVAALAILSKVGGFGAILGGTGILIAVQSLADLAEGLKSFADMSWDEIGRGLVAMGGALGEVAGVTGLLGKLAGFSSIFASGAILIVVQGLADLASAFSDFGNMSWGEIGRGLVGMGGALGEVAGITGVVGKLAGFSSIFASGAILIVVQGLVDLASAFKDFGSIAWDEIGRGLVGMGGALGEVAGITGLLGKLAGFAGIFGSGAILIVVQGLDDLATSFAKFGEMSWGEIGRGLVGMCVALLEVGGITGALGYLTNFAGLLGSGSLWIAIQGLNDLADAFKKFGEMSWDEIGRGLSAMGAAMGEVALGGILNTLSGLGAISISEVAEPLGILADSVKKWVGVEVPDGLGLKIGALAAGVQAFTFGGLGALAISEVAAPLGTMADSVMKWSGVTLPEGLGEQLAALASGVGSFTFGGFGASAIAEVAVPLGDLATSVSKWSTVTVPEGLGTKLTSIADGIKSFTWAFMGGWSLDTVIEPLGALPDAIAKWKNISVPENLGTQLSTLADGIKSFSWAFMGGWSLDTVVEPLGALSSSIAKWSGITVPEGLGAQLETLAGGIKAFTFGGSGASTIAEAASPLGTLADSVNKWIGITVPEELGTSLSTLAGGVKAFTFGGSGAGTLSEVAAPLGTLADSVMKWSGVTIPEGLGENLKTLAGGVKSFTFGGSGAGTLTEVAAPLGILANSVRKWSGLTVPEDLGSNLKTLSGAVKSFTFGGSGAGTLSEVAAPLGTMADSVRKWVGLTIPEDLGSNLKTLAGGVKAFGFGGSAAGTISEVAAPLGTLAGSVSKWTNVTIPENLGSQIKSFANGIKAFSGVGDISGVATGMGNIASKANSLATVNYSAISAGVKQLVDATSSLASIDSSSANSLSTITKAVTSAASSISNSASKFSSAGSNLVKALASGIQGSSGSVTAAVTGLVNGIKATVTACANLFTSAGETLASKLASGINSGKSAVSGAGKNVASSASSGARGNWSGMYSAGVYLGQGLVNGISAKVGAAYQAGYKLGAAAVQGELDGQNSASPSKETIKAGKWLGEGLVIGIRRMGSAVYDAGSGMGKNAVRSVSDSVSKISEAINSNLDSQPTIRPVMDLSDIRSKANSLNNMLDIDSSVGVLANVGTISSMMNRRGQNGGGNEVVSAINQLRKDIAAMPRESYQINGVTYDDGSNIRNFAQEVVRQAKVGRRV